MLFLTFIVSSIFECMSLFILCMALFRFQIKEFFSKFLISSVILAFVSNTLQVESLQDIAPLVNVVLLIFLATIILRTRLLHSIIMVVISYIIFTLVQWLIYTIVIKEGLFNNIVTYTWSGFFLQGVSGCVMLLLAGTIIYRKGGFSYIQSSGRFYKESFRDNRLFLICLLLALIVVFGTNVFYLTFDKIPTYLYTVAIIIIVVLVVLLYFSVRKDDRS
ncbi:hypothetical protein COLU111180_10280 [Cohnella lubricantis]|nr:hypothetical protein [Cohnella lubricantis]